ncbi:MAG: cupin domain-containing protein [Candidatus Hadarchaeia archaeon]
MTEKKNSVLKKLVGNNFKTRELIEYQDNAVVSKTIIDKEAGTITIFAFDKEQSLSEHTAPFEALAQILDGKCKIKMEDEEIEISEGEALIIPEDRPHSVIAVERFKMLLTMIKSD